MTPSVKRRKITQRSEEIVFDADARQDYLTGFHKRKQQRIKHAQEQAAKYERELKVESRKHLREQRRKDLETHIQTVEDMMRTARRVDDGFVSEDENNKSSDNTFGEGDVQDPDPGMPPEESGQQEYIDEDKYTTVTVGPLDVAEDIDSNESEGDDSSDRPKGNGEAPAGSTSLSAVKRRAWTKEKPTSSKAKKKRKKFRYETKVERKAERSKLAARNSAAAKVRRSRE